MGYDGMMGSGLTMLLMMGSVRLAVQGYADGIHEVCFRPLNRMMDSFVTAGGQILVCGAFIMEIVSQDAGSLSY